MGDAEDELEHLYWWTLKDFTPQYCSYRSSLIHKGIESSFLDTGIVDTKELLQAFCRYTKKQHPAQKLGNIEFIYQMWKLNREEDGNV